MNVNVGVPAQAWDAFVTARSAPHVLQTAPWGALKSAFGWEAERVLLEEEGRPIAGAQVLFQTLPLGVGKLAYVPMGPLVDWEDAPVVTALVECLAAVARRRGAIVLTIEPDLEDHPRWKERLGAAGFVPSPLKSVQPRRTIIVDVSPDEDAILAAMKPKTRYNIRLAERKGVTVREGSVADLPAFCALMAETAERNAFGVHTPAYYERAYGLFAPRGWGRLLLAEVDGAAVAALMVFALGPRAWYFYGASGSAHREKMPPYLLQWEAMRWSRSLGCTAYDLWGVPDADEETLEAEFDRRGDGLWGVYRFKRGFGGRLMRTAGAWDRPLRPVLYRCYTLALRWHRTGG
ncbi:MAG: peptidoglycan bridge formation glycyltransferase FemA/FemB family protein [Anaerolineae bacterium]|nr:peptidoglycan bridge formation glycyltransferase FemA/FemB family protein [Anaerolineae bacterium]